MKQNLAHRLIPEPHQVFNCYVINWFTPKQTEIMLTSMQVWMLLERGLQQQQHEKLCSPYGYIRRDYD